MLANFARVLLKSTSANLKNYTPGVVLNCKYSFKSDLSPDVLYPGCNLRLYTPAPVPQSKDGKFTGFIPMDRLTVTYSRSSGPGGQHVNCVNTKVDVRFHVESADWISEHIRQRLLEEHYNRITKEGYFVIKSDVTRSQHLNLADALEKIRCLIRDLELSNFALPTEETLEKIRRRHEKATRERLQLKRQRSQTKFARQSPMVDS